MSGSESLSGPQALSGPESLSGPGSPVARLSQSLDRVHDLLRRGDLTALPEAASVMEAHLAVLAGADGAGRLAADLAGLRWKLERNAACLQGAARGIRAARRRIAEVRGAATALGAYDASGQRVSGYSVQTQLARRF